MVLDGTLHKTYERGNCFIFVDELKVHHKEIVLVKKNRPKRAENTPG